MSKDFATFKFARQDTWGNPMVRCPVCGWTHKLDGIRKHIQNKALQGGDKKHLEWLKKHRWHKGTKTPARAGMRP